MSGPKKKCPCCKFDRAYGEFNKHRSHTSFAALNLIVDHISRWVLEPASIKEDARVICEDHTRDVGAFMDSVFAAVDSLKSGVPLVKIVKR